MNIKSPYTSAPILRSMFIRLTSFGPFTIFLWSHLHQCYVNIEPKWLRSVHPSPESTYASPSQNHATTPNKDPFYSEEPAWAALVT